MATQADDALTVSHPPPPTLSNLHDTTTPPPPQTLSSPPAPAPAPAPTPGPPATGPATPASAPPQPTSQNEAFTYPPHAHFPPFYTLQPNAATRASQLASWSALITAWAAHTRTFRLTPTHAIFASPSLRAKRLPPDDARAVLQYMVDRGAAEWISPPRVHAGTPSTGAAAAGGGGSGSGGEEGEVRLWWLSAEEWAAALDSWAARTGQRGTVLTLWELVDGPAGVGEAFHGLPVEMAVVAARVLARRGKASVFGEGDGLGVKFYF